MGLSSKTENRIKDLLIKIVRNKLRNYKPETRYMPFHYRLFGKDRYAMFSFIQSINTSFGISIWEQVAVILAEEAGYHAEHQYNLVGEIDKETEEMIRELHHKLRLGEIKPDKLYELELIKKSIKKGEKKIDPDSRVDLYIKIGDQENYFDITTVKPNKKEFAALKLKLMRWTALRLSQNGSANVFTRLGIPYNPYHPKPYVRWTLSGLLDMERKEILVGEKFWNFVANDVVYRELLDVFEEVGRKLRYEIDEIFFKFHELK